MRLRLDDRPAARAAAIRLIRPSGPIPAPRAGADGPGSGTIASVCTVLYVPWRSGSFRAALGLNRDEVYARPAASPRWWPASPDTEGGVGFVAPVDLVAGGTWFGLAQTGLFVALTNGRQAFRFRRERSRGELVVSSLRAGTLEQATAALERRDSLAYAPCHLLLARGNRVTYVAPDPQGRFVVQQLPPDPHTLTNAGLDAGDTPDLSQHTTGLDADGILRELRTRLATHRGPTARCRHGRGRGTRSSALLLLGDELASSHLRYADGPPCVTHFADVPLPALAPR